MKVKYLVALAAVSVLSVGTLASCGPSEPADTGATEEVAPDAGAMEEPAMEDPAMDEGAMEDPAMEEPAAPDAAE